MILSVGIIVFLVGKKIPHVIKNLDKKPKPGQPKKQPAKTTTENSNQGIAQKTNPTNNKAGIGKTIFKTIKQLVLKADTAIMQLVKKLKTKKEELTSINENDLEKNNLKKNILDRIKKTPKEKEVREEVNFNENGDKKIPILKRMSEIREKLTSKEPKEIKKKTIIRNKKPEKQVANQTKKAKQTPKAEFPKRKVDLEQTRKVMFERQEEALIKKISANPKDDKAYVELGKLYAKAENIEDAKASFKQAIKINRGNFEAKKQLKILAEKI